MSVAAKLEKNLAGDKENILAAGGRRISFPRRPLIMGALDLGGSSHSGGGPLDAGRALSLAAEMVSGGADIVEVRGGGACPGPAAGGEEEWERIAPFVQGFRDLAAAPRDEGQVFPPLLSVSTWWAGSAARALQAGCDLLCGMEAPAEGLLARLCAEHGAALLIVPPAGGLCRETHRETASDLALFFESRIALAMSAGLPREATILSLGADFSSLSPGSLRICRELTQLSSLARPILVPLSSMSAPGGMSDIGTPAGSDAGEVACIVAGALRGASIFRVRDVGAAWFALRTLEVVG
ncbi:MAG: dihydropteroate synthase [Verrucomicrobiae bacterium]